MSGASMRQALIRALRVGSLKQAGRTAVAAVLTQIVVTLLGLTQGYWAVITTVIVMQANLGGSIRAAWTRLAGTAVGAISGIVAGLIGGQSLFALGLAVLVTLSVCGLLPRLRDSSRVAGITVVIVILAGHPAESPITLGLSRFTEISIGIITALATSALVFPSRASAALGRGLSKVFEDVASLFAVVVEGRLREDYPERHVFALKDRLVRTLNRCRQLRLEADIEGRREDAAIRDMLLVQGARLFEHVLGLDHVASEARGGGLHRHLPEELLALETATAAVLTSLAAHLRDASALPDLTTLDAAVAQARVKLAAMRKERAPAAYDLSEVMHFFSFIHGMLACAADARDITSRLVALGREEVAPARGPW
ncbi:MAG: aromatic acid exporter family protein [Desulfovibrionaceae bacterium]